MVHTCFLDLFSDRSMFSETNCTLIKSLKSVIPHTVKNMKVLVIKVIRENFVRLTTVDPQRT